MADASVATESKAWIINEKDENSHMQFQEDSKLKSILKKTENKSKDPQTKGVSSFMCHVCNIDLNSNAQFEQHLSGAKHKRILEQKNRSANSADVAFNENDDTGYQLFEPCSPSRGFTQTVQQNNLPSGSQLLPHDCPTGLVQNSSIQHAKKFSSFTISVPERSGWFYCSICDVTVNSETQLQQHLTSKRHQSNKNVERPPGESSLLGSNIPEEPFMPKPSLTGSNSPLASYAGQNKITELLPTVGNLYCQVCDVAANSLMQYEQHMNSRKHNDRVSGKPMMHWKAKSARPSKGFLDLSGRPGKPYYNRRKQDCFGDTDAVRDKWKSPLHMGMPESYFKAQRPTEHDWQVSQMPISQGNEGEIFLARNQPQGDLGWRFDQSRKTCEPMDMD